MSWRGRQLKRPQIRAGGFYFSRGFAARSRALRTRISRLRCSCARIDKTAMLRRLHFKRLQAVRSVASSGKFYRLPPDKENTVVWYKSTLYGLFRVRAAVTTKIQVAGYNNWELKQGRQWWQYENDEKCSRFRLQNNNFAGVMLCCTFLCCLCTTTVWCETSIFHILWRMWT